MGTTKWSGNDSSNDLSALCAMELYPFATEADRGRYQDRFRRHKTLAHARSSLALSKGGGKIYEYNYTTDEWTEYVP